MTRAAYWKNELTNAAMFDIKNNKETDITTPVWLALHLERELSGKDKAVFPDNGGVAIMDFSDGSVLTCENVPDGTGLDCTFTISGAPEPPDDYMGLCPKCHKEGGLLVIDLIDLLVCDDCKVFWRFGSNNFTEPTRSEEERTTIRTELGTFKFEEKGYYYPETLARNAATLA